MGVRGVVHVPGEVLGPDLPVGLDSPTLRTAHLHPATALFCVEVQVKPEVAEEFLQRLRIGVHADEYQAVVAREIRCRKQALAIPGESVVAAVGLPVER